MGWTPNTAQKVKDVDGLRTWIEVELQRLARYLSSALASLWVETLHVAPDRPRNGMIVYADGTHWNPGSGEGFYGYQAGSWVKL